MKIVFINDFSTDGTANVLKRIVEPKAQFKIYDNKRKGFGRGNN